MFRITTAWLQRSDAGHLVEHGVTVLIDGASESHALARLESHYEGSPGFVCFTQAHTSEAILSDFYLEDARVLATYTPQHLSLPGSVTP